MSWDLKNKKEVSADWYLNQANFEMDDAIIYYDRPLIYFFVDGNGRRMLAYVAENAGEELERYIISPVDEDQEKDLLANKITFKDIFQKGELWVIESYWVETKECKCWEIGFKDIPEYMLSGLEAPVQQTPEIANCRI